MRVMTFTIAIVYLQWLLQSLNRMVSKNPPPPGMKMLWRSDVIMWHYNAMRKYGEMG